MEIIKDNVKTNLAAHLTKERRHYLINTILSHEKLKKAIYQMIKTPNISNAQIDMISVMSAVEKEWKKHGIYLGAPIANFTPFYDKRYELDAVFSNYRKYIFEMDGSLHLIDDDNKKDRFFIGKDYIIIRLRSASLGDIENQNTIIIPDNRLPLKKKKELILYINSIFNLDFIDYEQILSNVPLTREDFWITYNIENNNKVVDKILTLIDDCVESKFELQACY
jgi:uncharacterized phage-like protein YoqJ